MLDPKAQALINLIAEKGFPATHTLSPAEARPDEELLRLHTGGTTGTPRLWPKTGINLLGAGYEPMLISTMAPGGFMIFGLTLGVANIIMKSIEKKKKAKEAA